MNVRFITKKKHKIKEIKSLLENTGVSIISAEHSIDEIQTENVEALIRDKLLKAFKLVGRPVFVEHTGLYIESLNGFPGGLTQIFWDKLQADSFSKLLGVGENPKLIAKTIIGYCDSMKIYIFEGEVYGKISPVPKGPRDFQWDCIFIPDGESKTFAEMGEMKNEISMRKKAFDKFKNYLLGE